MGDKNIIDSFTFRRRQHIKKATTILNDWLSSLEEIRDQYPDLQILNILTATVKKFLDITPGDWKTGFLPSSTLEEDVLRFSFNSILLGQEPKEFFSIKSIAPSNIFNISENLLGNAQEIIEHAVEEHKDLIDYLMGLGYATYVYLRDNNWSVVNIDKTSDNVFKFTFQKTFMYEKEYSETIEIGFDFTTMERDKAYMDQWMSEGGQYTDSED